MKFKKVLPFLVLLIASITVIFFQFNQIPKNLTFDEVEFAKLALSLDGAPYSAYSPLATGHSTFYFYIILASFKIFGVSNFALRFPSALFGVLGVVMFYFTIKQVFKKNQLLPFLLTLIFLSLRWYFNFARFSFEATLLMFLELTSIYFFFKSNLPLSGMFAGLAFNSYTPGRFFFALPGFFLGLDLIQKKWSKKVIRQLLLFTVPFLIVITPLMFYLVTNQDTRVDRLFFWKNHEMTVGEKVEGTWQNVVTVSSMFFFKGDINGKHNYPGKPALNPLIGLLFIAGLVLAVKRHKDFYNLFFILYFVLSFLPSIMIYPWENPSMLRTFTIIPSVVYFIGLTFQAILKRIKFRYLGILLIALVAASSLYELRTYFQFQATVFESAFETKPQLEDALEQTNFKY